MEYILYRQLLICRVGVIRDAEVKLGEGHLHPLPFE